VTTPNTVPTATDKPPIPAAPDKWPLWRALLWQVGTVVLVTAGLFAAKSALGSLDGIAAQSIGLAALLVGFAGAVALAIASLARDPKQAAAMVLAGMLVRLFVPLAALLMVSKQWPELEEAGFREQVLVLYLVALVVETYAAIRVTGMPAPRFASK
jgi:hypothetical protein